MRANKTVQFGALTKRDGIDDQSWSYQFDLVSDTQPRSVWMHKNQSDSNGIESYDRLAYTQPVTQITIGDFIVFSVPLFDTYGSFMDYTEGWEVTFSKLRIETIPLQFTPHKETKYQKPNMEELMKNELAKTWNFFKQSYYRHDLKRVCEMEELVEHWYQLSIKPEERVQR